MTTIRRVLQKLDYPYAKINGIARLLLLPDDTGLNCFSNFTSLLKQVSLGQREQLWLDKVAKSGMTSDSFPQEWLEETKLSWQNERLVNSVLDHEFNLSEDDLFKVLVALTQLQFILKSRFKTFSGNTNLYEKDLKKEVPFAIQRLVSNLGFSAAHEHLKEDGEVGHVFLHAATESAIIPRLKLLNDIANQQESSIVVYYSTNPRGLSKNEASTAEILASWFTEDGELQANIAKHIKEVLSDQNLKVDWFNGLNEMRNKILDSVNKQFNLQFTEFPSAPNDEIYPSIYNETAELEKRDLIDNKWPHAGHLLTHLANKLGLDTNKISIKIIEVPGTIVEGRFKPAQTFELLGALFDPKLTASNAKIFISDKSVSYAAERQALMTELLLQQKGLDYKNIVTYYDGADLTKVDFERITKEVAATFYTLYEFSDLLEQKYALQKSVEEVVSPQSYIYN